MFLIGGLFGLGLFVAADALARSALVLLAPVPPSYALPGVVATLHPTVNQDIFYFGTWGDLSNKTNPLPNKLTSTPHHIWVHPQHGRQSTLSKLLKLNAPHWKKRR
jgi:hypothetical protein